MIAWMRRHITIDEVIVLVIMVVFALLCWAAEVSPRNSGLNSPDPSWPLWISII